MKVVLLLRFFRAESFRSSLRVARSPRSDYCSTLRRGQETAQGRRNSINKMSLNLPSVRRSTFHKTRRGASKPLNWPHPLVPKSLSIHADKLSQAGFVHSPTLDEPDRTTCYLCSVQVSGWEAGDEVWGKHRDGNADCAFLKMEEVVWNEWKEETQWDWGVDGVDWPRSERMDRARLETFAVGWPHDGALGIPTKEEVVFSPLSWIGRGLMCDG